MRKSSLKTMNLKRNFKKSEKIQYVFTGFFEGDFNLNSEEVSEVRYISVEDLDREMKEKPENFTEWFKIILNEYKQHLS